MANYRANGLLYILTLCFSLILVSCSMGPNRSSQVAMNETGLTPTQQQTTDYAKSAAHYLTLAQSHPDQANEYTLLAADMYSQAEDQVKAESLLANIQKDNLTAQQQVRWSLIEARLALLKGQPQIALGTLAPQQKAAQSSPELERQYLTVKALAHARLNQHTQSIQARLKLDPLLVDPKQISANRQAIWNALNGLPTQTLMQMSNQSHSENEMGWYQLAQINHQYDTNPDILNQQIALWRQTYPIHPANDVLPKSNSYLTSNYASDLPSAPQRVALLLPLTGKHGGPANAIRDGFLAGYYQGKNKPTLQPEIKVYDTTSRDPAQVYQQAVMDGADFVVGPLAKEDVLSISKLSESQLRVPVLALNHNDQIGLVSSKFYQFSLSPENEAEAVADKAFADGHRRAGIVIPNNAWGRRIAQSFKSYWQRKGGQVQRIIEVDPTRDQSAPIRTLLNIDESKERANAANKTIGVKAEFQPYRDHDIDFIVLAAPPEQARQLRPLFEFYYAGDLPVYATSSIYSGSPNPTKDRDMNGIIFCDMPWILDQQHPSQSARNQIQSNLPDSGGQYHRLYAMGVDAFVLTSQLSRLAQYPNMGLPAATGTLYLGPKHQIERRLQWAKIKNGVPQAL
jgi:uncharacterized protein